MCVARKHIDDFHLAHDDERCEINERDVRFVVILLVQLPRLTKLPWGNMDELVIVLIHCVPEALNERFGLGRFLLPIEVSDDFAED